MFGAKLWQNHQSPAKSRNYYDKKTNRKHREKWERNWSGQSKTNPKMFLEKLNFERKRKWERERECQTIALPSFPYLYSFYVPENCRVDNLLGNQKIKGNQVLYIKTSIQPRLQTLVTNGKNAFIFSQVDQTKVVF